MKKKRPSDRGASAPRWPEPSILASRYETLRQAALGAALAPEARGGLALFLRLGMCGWVRTMASLDVAPRPIRQQQQRFTATSPHAAVIHILAAMTMNLDERRAPCKNP